MSGDKQDSQADWEDEGGAIEQERKQKTPKGLKIPVPNRKELMDGFRKIIRPVKKP